MTKYLIWFPGSAMDHIAQEDFPAGAEASHELVREAKRAGVLGSRWRDQRGRPIDHGLW